MRTPSSSNVTEKAGGLANRAERRPRHSPGLAAALGASDAASEVAALAAHVGFEVTAVDYDAAYLNEGRFPDAHRILLEGGDFDGLARSPVLGGGRPVGALRVAF